MVEVKKRGKRSGARGLGKLSLARPGPASCVRWGSLDLPGLGIPGGGAGAIPGRSWGGREGEGEREEAP
jgi:hypothetical protein